MPFSGPSIYGSCIKQVDLYKPYAGGRKRYVLILIPHCGFNDKIRRKKLKVNMCVYYIKQSKSDKITIILVPYLNLQSVAS